MATVWTAAITGLVAFSIAEITLSKLGSWTALGEPNSLMSAPPEKALPAPVKMMALTWSSANAFSRPATMACRVFKPNPLTGGLFMVITAKSPWTV